MKISVFCLLFASFIIISQAENCNDINTASSIDDCKDQTFEGNFNKTDSYCCYYTGKRGGKDFGECYQVQKIEYDDGEKEQLKEDLLEGTDDLEITDIVCNSKFISLGLLLVLLSLIF